MAEAKRGFDMSSISQRGAGSKGLKAATTRAHESSKSERADNDDMRDFYEKLYRKHEGDVHKM
jgi:hypothetical protein